MPRKKRTLTKEHKEKMQAGRKAAKEKAKDFSLKYPSFTISADRENWILDYKGEVFYYSNLKSLALMLLQKRLRHAEVKSMEQLVDAIRAAEREITMYVPKAVKPFDVDVE